MLLSIELNFMLNVKNPFGSNHKINGGFVLCFIAIIVGTKTVECIWIERNKNNICVWLRNDEESQRINQVDT